MSLLKHIIVFLRGHLCPEQQTVDTRTSKDIKGKMGLDLLLLIPPSRCHLPLVIWSYTETASLGLNSAKHLSISFTPKKFQLYAMGLRYVIQVKDIVVSRIDMELSLSKFFSFRFNAFKAIYIFSFLCSLLHFNIATCLFCYLKLPTVPNQPGPSTLGKKKKTNSFLRECSFL